MSSFEIVNKITGYVNNEDFAILKSLHKKYKMVTGSSEEITPSIKKEVDVFQVAPNKLLRVVYRKEIVWVKGKPYPKYTILEPSKEVLKKYL